MVELDNSNPFITFQDVTPAERRTRVVQVLAVRDGALLGTVKWFGRWRRYAFFPEPACVFDADCLEVVAVNARILSTAWRIRDAIAAGKADG